MAGDKAVDAVYRRKSLLFFMYYFWLVVVSVMLYFIFVANSLYIFVHPGSRDAVLSPVSSCFFLFSFLLSPYCCLHPYSFLCDYLLSLLSLWRTSNVKQNTGQKKKKQQLLFLLLDCLPPFYTATTDTQVWDCLLKCLHTQTDWEEPGLEYPPPVKNKAIKVVC